VAAAKEKTATAAAKPAARGAQAGKTGQAGREEIFDDGQAGSVPQPGGEPADELGLQHGQECLDIEQIALHGVVKSDNGMIAVVTNALNKAYFLREKRSGVQRVRSEDHGRFDRV